MNDTPALTGGCNCGAVRYLVTRPLLTVYICHCHLCQKRTGSAFSMSVVLPADGLQIVAGELLWTERLLPSGTRNVSWLCPACYSRIYTRREGAQTINLRAGTLDDTSQIRPVAQFWTSSAQPWALIKDDVLSYAEQPTDYAPLLAAWQAVAKGQS
ncbi:MAG: GFA family protein [Acetobacteraceae bacterium]|nr:GFA family protein [Acetobacteraceae bacterium]